MIPQLIRNYTSPIDGHHYGVGVRQVFEDFEPDGALAGNYLRVVKGVYKDGAGFFLQTHCFGICLDTRYWRALTVKAAMVKGIFRPMPGSFHWQDSPEPQHVLVKS